MIKYHHILVLLLSLLVVVTGCRKDIDGLGNSTEVFNPVDVKNSTIANLSGLVTDLSGEAISNADVELNGEVVTTDQFGYFRFTEKIIDNEGSVVKISNDGYFDSYKFVYPTSAGDFSHIEVALPTRNLTGSFTASSGGEITTTDGAKVTFTESTIMDEDGNAYTGSVNVYTYWYNPNASDLSQTMPGDLRATDSEGNEVQLATFGMLAVELETPDGASLNISVGNTAQLTFPLEGLTDSAPDEVPLWYLDEESGVWIEDGTATKVGNTYVGDVTHFSFWNCDAPFPLVNINGIIKDDNDNLLTNALICMQVQDEGTSWWNTGYGWTDENGEYAGKIPKNKLILLTVKDNCGNVIYEEQIGPFDADVVMDPIIVNAAGLNTISGMVTDCDGNVLTSGYVLIKVDNPQFEGLFDVATIDLDENGTFSYTGSLCQNLSGTIQAFDLETQTLSEEIPFDLIANEDLDLGVISLCEMLEEFLIIDIDGDTQLWTEVDLCIVDGNASFTAIETNFMIENLMLGSNTTSGSYSFFVESSTNSFVSCFSNCNPINVEITDLGTSTGDYVEGTYEGTVPQQQGGDQIVSGSFRIMIDFIGEASSVSGVVWEDTNGNGIREAGEPPYAGAFLGTSGASTQTDANGMYTLSNLKPGEYFVWIEAEFPLSPSNQGNDDTIDSDFDSLGVQITLASGEDLMNVDAGFNTSNTATLDCEVALLYYCELDGGAIFVETSGGAPPYQYTAPDLGINSNDPTIEIDGVPPGTYDLTVTDANGDVCSTIFQLFNTEISSVQVFAWLDNDEDGAMNNNVDGPIPGTVIQILDPGGEIFASTTFGENTNSFTFGPLFPGTYFARVIAPDGFVIGDVPGSQVPNLFNANIDPNADDNTTGDSDFFEVIGCEDYFEFGAAIVPE